MISNVMEAVRVLSRISINKVIWKEKNAMLQSLVQLHQLAVEENILQQIQDVVLKSKRGRIDGKGIGGWRGGRG